MKTQRIRGTIAVAAALAVLGAGGIAPAWAESDTAAKVTAAKTAADHEALATQYEKRAAAARLRPLRTGEWEKPTKARRPRRERRAA
jgi:hypothetical protein